MKLNAHTITPESGSKVDDFVSRWSNTRLSLPAAVSSPKTEEDIVAAISYAAANNLKVIPADGGRGTAVPIDNCCLYLDMKHFNTIDLDENAATVTLGGGVITRDVARMLEERGFYTSVPSSNAVGIVGYCLGGGHSAFNGLKGLAIDNITYIRIITAAGKTLELSPHSSAEEADLFNVLCGAGFGFGVITSLTLRVWRVDELSMDENRAWTRKLVFAPPAIQTAAELYSRLQHPEPNMMVTLLFLRAPPSAPKPGIPMILLNVVYFGPYPEAEKAAAATYDPAITRQAIVAETTSMPLSALNDASEPLNRHGDYKELYSAWLASITPEGIVAAFERWIRFGEETPEAKNASYTVLVAKGTKAVVGNDVEGRKFVPRAIRSRPVFAQMTPWWTSEAAEPKARAWAAEMLDILKASQRDSSVVNDGSRVDGDEQVTGSANNLSKGINVNSVWPARSIEEIRRLKAHWDPDNRFWCPVVDGV